MDEKVKFVYLYALKYPRSWADGGLWDLYNLRKLFNHRPDVGIFKKIINRIKNGTSN